MYYLRNIKHLSYAQSLNSQCWYRNESQYTQIRDMFYDSISDLMRSISKCSVTIVKLVIYWPLEIHLVVISPDILSAPKPFRIWPINLLTLSLVVPFRYVSGLLSVRSGHFHSYISSIYPCGLDFWDVTESSLSP